MPVAWHAGVRRNRARRVSCAVSVLALIVGLLAVGGQANATAAPATAAAAIPTGEWWFTQLGIDKAQKITQGPV